MKIRKAELHDISAIATLKISSWQSTYQNLIPDDFLEQLSHVTEVDALTAFLNDKKLKVFGYVAENKSGQIVGYALGGLARSGNSDYKGELYAIYILDNYQKKGTGRLLIEKMVKELIQIGINSMLIWILAENPSRGFYEHFGGAEIDAQTLTLNGVRLNLVAYGWKELN